MHWQYRNTLIVTRISDRTRYAVFGTIINELSAAHPEPRYWTNQQWPCAAQPSGSPILQEAIDMTVIMLIDPQNLTELSYLATSAKSCNVPDLASTWYVPTYFHWSYAKQSYHVHSEGGQYRVAKVKYCLAEKPPAACTIRLSRSMLIAVIVANLLELSCFLMILIEVNTIAPQSQILADRRCRQKMALL